MYVIFWHNYINGTTLNIASIDVSNQECFVSNKKEIPTINKPVWVNILRNKKYIDYNKTSNHEFKLTYPSTLQHVILFMKLINKWHSSWLSVGGKLLMFYKNNNERIALPYVLSH